MRQRQRWLYGMKIRQYGLKQVLQQLGLVALFFAVSGDLAAQTKPFDNPTTVANPPQEGIGVRAGSFVGAPIVFDSPSLGTGLALGGAYLFKSDVLSDTSSIGFGGFRTSNSSEGFGLGLNLSWDEDAWTVSFLLARADINYDLYLLGQPFAVGQTLEGANIEVAHNPSGNFLFGGSLGYGETTLSPRFGTSLPPSFLIDADLKIARVSGFGEYDTRDDTFYPTTGTVARATLTRGIYVDSDRSGYTKAVGSVRMYKPVFDQGVLAGQAVACRATDNAPFFDSCSLGATDNFRGYVSTEFLGEALVSVQGEYRGRLTGRLGFTVFGGAGSVGDDVAGAFTGDYQAAAGVGLRLRLSKQFPLDYAIDYATNERGEQLLYVSVGQRF